jgi:cellulose synthase/poly-beta-1,6-N-acetylglucosamine synthase-like glycosyltransferase
MWQFAQQSEKLVAQTTTVYGRQVKMESWQQLFTTFCDSVRVTWNLGLTWFENNILGKSFTVGRGNCMLIHADVLRRVTFDMGQRLSVADDTAYVNLCSFEQIKIGFIRGFAREFSPPTVRGLLQQRAKWMRGHLYVAAFAPMGPLQRAIFCLFLVTWLSLPLCGILAPLATLLSPLGCLNLLWSVPNSIVTASTLYSVLYGSYWNFDFTPALFSLLILSILTTIPVFLAAAVEFSAVCLGVKCFLQEVYSNKPPDYVVSAK